MNRNSKRQVPAGKRVPARRTFSLSDKKIAPEFKDAPKNTE
jgi:hypothetical protein